MADKRLMLSLKAVARS